MFECEYRGYCTRDCEACEIAEEQKAIADLKNAINDIQEYLEAFAQAAVQVATRLCDMYENFLKSYPNKKVVHLAFNSKSERVQKKNRKRILNDFKKGVKE